MRVSFVGAVERLAPAALKRRALPLARVADAIVSGAGEHAISQRITLITYGVRVLSAFIAYVSQVLLARWMGDFEYGIFAVVWVGAVLLGALAGFGMQTAILRFVPEYRERAAMGHLRGVLLGSRIQGILTATVLAAVGIAGLMLFGDVLSSYYILPLYLGAVTLPMLTLGEIQDNIARGFNWAAVGLWPTFVIRPLLILAFMGIAIFAGATATAVTAMAAVIVATYLTSVGQTIWLRREVGKVVPSGPRQYAAATWLAIALPIFLVEGFFNLLTNIDIIFVGWYLAPEMAGVYFAAAKTMALVHFIYFAVRAGGAPRFSQYYAAGDKARLAAFTRDTMHWTFWPSLAMVAVLLVVGKPLLLLFGPSFGDGYILIPIFSVGVLARASIGPAETVLIMAGQQAISAWVYGAAFLLNVALNMWLTPRFGLVGAAWATSISLIAETIALYIISRTRLGLRSSIFDALMPARPAEAA